MFFPNKIKALGTDGAPMMFGHINGLYGLFKKICGEIFHVHCYAH